MEVGGSRSCLLMDYTVSQPHVVIAACENFQSSERFDRTDSTLSIDQECAHILIAGPEAAHLRYRIQETVADPRRSPSMSWDSFRRLTVLAAPRSGCMPPYLPSGGLRPRPLSGQLGDP